jgi:rhodanese-related sulfurtransferase
MSIKPAKDLVAEANAAVRTVTVQDALDLHASGTVQFVDVREPEEWAKGHIPGAVHVPRGLLEWAADPSNPTHKAEFDAGKPLVIQCASGGRSALAARTLKDMGYKDVANMLGGLAAWREAGGPVEGG